MTDMSAQGWTERQISLCPATIAPQRLYDDVDVLSGFIETITKTMVTPAAHGLASYGGNSFVEYHQTTFFSRVAGALTIGDYI